MNKKEQQKKLGEMGVFFSKILQVVIRWSYLFFLIAAAAYCAWVWRTYLYDADWSDEKKQEYIKQQAVFSFDSGSFKKTEEILSTRREEMQNFQGYQGKNIFFP